MPKGSFSRKGIGLSLLLRPIQKYDHGTLRDWRGSLAQTERCTVGCIRSRWSVHSFFFPVLFWWIINTGVGMVTAISAMVTGLTIGGFLGKRIWFRAIVRSEHDRFPQGIALERACVSQSERAALVGLGSTIREWQHPAPPWIPDMSHDGVSLFVTVTFGVSFFFVVGEVLLGLVILAVQTSGTCC